MARHLRERLCWGKVTIEPHSDDERAIACFEKAGFEDRGERRDDGDHTHVILEWP
jgi:RimJ/RimL family protein N-acetyltransferase